MNPTHHSSPLFRGSCAALITPFRGRGIDEEAVRRLCALQIDSGAGAILVAGTTGEGALLRRAERNLLIGTARELLRERASSLPLIAAVGCSDTQATCRAARDAAKAGASALLIITPPYIRSTESGLCEHLRAASRASGLPILLYHVPSRTGQTLSPRAWDAVAERCPEVVGIKEASGEIGQISFLREQYGDRFSLYCGSDELNLPALALGADGLISVLAVPCPTLTAALCRAAFEQDFGTARALHFASLPLIRALFAKTNPVPVKSLMASLGACSPLIRLPLTPADAPTARAVLDALRKLQAALPAFADDYE